MQFPMGPVPPERDDENPYWMSFSDIMAGILIIFIIVCCTLVFRLSEMREDTWFDRQKIVDAREAADRQILSLQRDLRLRKEIMSEIRSILARQDINLDMDGDSLIVPVTALDFASNSYAISTQKNKDAAVALGRALRDALVKDDRWKKLETVFIEGHTDSQPTITFKMGNWQLSALRAIQLWKFWTEEHAADFGSDLLAMKHVVRTKDGNRSLNLFSVSGYADTRRRVPQDLTDEQRRLNRRINIRFVTRQISPDELESIRDPLRKMTGPEKKGQEAS